MSDFSLEMLDATADAHREGLIVDTIEFLGDPTSGHPADPQAYQPGDLIIQGEYLGIVGRAPAGNVVSIALNRAAQTGRAVVLSAWQLGVRNKGELKLLFAQVDL